MLSRSETFSYVSVGVVCPIGQYFAVYFSLVFVMWARVVRVKIRNDVCLAVEVSVNSLVSFFSSLV